MSHPEKVPALLAALLLSAGLTACGGDAESAGDLDSTPYAEETWEGDADAPASPPVTTPAPPPAPTPAPATPPPATRPPVTPPPAPAPPAPTPPTPAPAPEPEPAGLTLPSGTQVTGILEAGLSTRTSEVGDTFHARIADAVRASDGTVILPAGSRLQGRVVESRESSSAEEQAALLLEIQGLVVNGEVLPIQATVLETQVATEARDSGQRSVATVATGAAAGAIIGRILGGDRRSTVAGAAAGAAAGAGIALTTRDGHATLEEGARITVRLNAPVVVAQP